MKNFKRIEVNYINGDANGLQIRKIALSVVTAFVIPRILLNEIKNIKGINNPGIYYLIEEDEKSSILKMYIGQTRNGVDRIDDHKRNKSFWNKAIFFLSNRENFDLNIISGLEKFAIEQAKNANRYAIENITTPKDITAEFDQPLIEKAYEDIEFLMATLGYDLKNIAEGTNKDKILTTSRRGIKAKGAYNGDKFEVLEGSEIDMGKEANLSKYNEQREQLIKENYIIKIDSKFILQKTIQFKTPSGASDFVLGSSTNGWVEWKNSEGKTLDELYRKQKE